MLNQISWNSYFEFVVIVLITYYSAILYVFYKTDIKNWLSLKFHTATFYKNGTEIFRNERSTNGSELMNHLLDEVKALIQNAANRKSPKEELLFAIQRGLSSERFQSIDIISSKDYINDLILKDCESICSIHLSKEDLRVLWI
jgi:hypothetical protein